MPRPPLSDILKNGIYEQRDVKPCLTVRGIEFAKFKMPQIKRQFNVFPLCLPSADY